MFLSAGNGADPDHLDVVDSWYNEVQNYTYNPKNNNDCDTDAVCGHYTQVSCIVTLSIEVSVYN